MRRITTGFVLSGLLLSAPVWAGDQEAGTAAAADDSADAADAATIEQPEIINMDHSLQPLQQGQQAGKQQPGEAQQYTGTTVAEEKPERKPTLSNEILAVRPNGGAMVYKDTLGNTTSRAVYGLTADWNLTSMFTNNPSWYFGPSTGGLFSHVGSAGSSFWGSSPTVQPNSPGSNTVIVPIDAKIGYNFADNFRAALRGGGNLTYRSQGISMQLGPSTDTIGSIWRLYPNVGADLDWGLAKNVSLGLRPDYTITPSNGIFTGTLALGISLG